MKVGIIGCGNMGGAILKGVIRERVVMPSDIALNDKISSKMAELSSVTGAGEVDLRSVVEEADYLVVAVKPQDSEQLLKEVAGYLSGQTVISIMAGVKINTMMSFLGDKVPVVRAMPNMCAFVNQSITCLAFNPFVREKEKIRSIFSGIGRVIEVEEEQLDAVTAVSGSGPAYLFYFADAMINSAKKVGLKEDLAKDLVIQTLSGAVELLKAEKDLSIEELICSVASKGGTTEAAFKRV